MRFLSSVFPLIIVIAAVLLPAIFKSRKNQTQAHPPKQETQEQRMRRQYAEMSRQTRQPEPYRENIFQDRQLTGRSDTRVDATTLNQRQPQRVNEASHATTVNTSGTAFSVREPSQTTTMKPSSEIKEAMLKQAPSLTQAVPVGVGNLSLFGSADECVKAVVYSEIMMPRSRARRT